MTTLGDVLLVLLADRGGTAHDIQRRHAATFGSGQRVDISRVAWTLSRQERLGLVRSAASPTHARQRRYEITEDGARRQRTWLLRVPAGGDAEEIRTRVLLAIEATDRDTFDAVVAACLAPLEPGPPTAGPPTAGNVPLTGDAARAELAAATLAAEVGWLRSLRTRPRLRDRIDTPSGS